MREGQSAAPRERMLANQLQADHIRGRVIADMKPHRLGDQAAVVRLVLNERVIANRRGGCRIDLLIEDQLEAHEPGLVTATLTGVARDGRLK